MIYAQHKPDIARAILGEKRYAEVTAKSGVPGGRGHDLYEEIVTLPEGGHTCCRPRRGKPGILRSHQTSRKIVMGVSKEQFEIATFLSTMILKM